MAEVANAVRRARLRFVTADAALLAELARAAAPASRSQFQPGWLDRLAQAAEHPNLALLDGIEVMGACGILPVWEGRGFAWMVASARAQRRHYGPAIGAGLRFLERQHGRFRRIECLVRLSDRPAIGWATRLGFAAEGVLKFAAPDGADMLAMARIREVHP